MERAAAEVTFAFEIHFARDSEGIGIDFDHGVKRRTGLVELLNAIEI